MLIVFDLDDTLIETSASISPFQLEQTFSLLLKEGLLIENSEKVLTKLLLEQKSDKSASLVLERFIFENQFDDKFYKVIKKGLSTLLPATFKVKTFPKVKEILEILSGKHILCLVSRGEELYQQQKIQKAGIDCSLFSKIIITPKKNKKFYYENLINEFGGSNFVVCGDNLDLDLIPAKELGGKTVLTSEGNDTLDHLGPNEHIDYKIARFNEIEAIIKKLEGIGDGISKSN